MNGRAMSSQDLTRWLGFALGLWTSLALAQDPPSAASEAPPATDAGPPPAAALPEAETLPETQAPPSSEPAPPGLVPFSAELASELDAYLDAASLAFHVPGAAVALIHGGEVAYVGTSGVRDVDGSAPVDLDTRFMIGSVTKSMTTTLAATLVEEGRLAWDDRVIDYLPGLALARPEWASELGLRDLFRHTSGVPRSDIELLVSYQRPRELIGSAASIAGAVAPGERYEYQNQMFSLGGFALARAVGAPLAGAALPSVYQRLMQRRVFEPLGMTRTTFDFERTVRDGDHSLPHSYDAEAGSVRPLPLDTERALLQILPAGAAWSTVVDMAQYFAMHLREGESVDGERIVAAASLLETHTPQVPIQGTTSYGLGWLIDESPFGSVLTHDGGTSGFTSRLIGLPGLDLGLVVLVNRSGGGVFIEAITRYVFELAFAAPHVGDADLLEASAQLELVGLELLAATAAVDPVALAPYLGRYERRLGVHVNGDDLVLSTVYGNLRFRAVTGMPDAYLCVDKAFLGFAALFSSDEQGGANLAIGIPNFETGALLQPVNAARLEDKPVPARPSHRSHDFRLVPVPHLTPHLNPELAPRLVPKARLPWAPR